jgi:peptidoglycan hydrolase-like protein with peptidoglycan-binding domain
MLPLFFNSAQSQPDRFAYAVTAINKGSSEWVALRKLDTRTGEFSSILLNMTAGNQALYDLSTHEIVVNATGNNSPLPALNSGVAAIAYDRKANRIYYVPMNKDQLHYVDLPTMKVFSVTDQSFSKAGKYIFQAASPITRLVIAPDDYGYTITNDGNHLIRFTTNGTPILTDQGELVDDPLNNEMTIHNACANAGGDLIADDNGHLYLISAGNRVFKLDITTRVTSFLATISGLPKQFTTNGVVVDENGKLLVSSSVYADAYFIVDPKTWNALPSPSNHPIYASADLANSNVLFTKTKAPAVLLLSRSLDKPGKIRVFPNPVLFDEVNIQFNELPPGNYMIQLANVLGRKVIEQKVIITGHNQNEIIRIPGFTAQGFYYIRVLNDKNIEVGTQKLAVEKW